MPANRQSISYPLDLSQPYALEASLFIRAHQYEQAQDTIKRFDAFEMKVTALITTGHGFPC